MFQTPMTELCVERLIDANLDRAREGLRVVEDWCRFGLNRKDLVISLKDWRQRLGHLHHSRYKRARSTAADQGAGLSHPAQGERITSEQVVAANCARVQEALRVLEEFSRQGDAELAETAADIRYGLYDMEVTVLQASQGMRRRNKLQTCRLYLITAPHNNLGGVVAAALDAGVGIVQYRSKDDTDHNRLQQATELAALCRQQDALFIVNDRIDLALAVDADGVHLGQDDLPTEVARSLMGSERLIGRSTHCLAHLQRAESEGVDYLGVGPVNATPTKPNRQPVGLSYVEEAAQKASLPWFAIGGIDSSTLGDVRQAGAQRVAVVTAVIKASDPGAASRELMAGLSCK